MEFHPVVKKIQDVLSANETWFERFIHEPVRTSEEASRVRDGYTLSQGAKALIVRTKEGSKKRFVMIVVPGDMRFDTKKAKDILKTKDIRFASKEEVGDITGGIVPGGVPPFGQLFQLDVYVDAHVLQNEKIIFNAGDKRVSIGMYTKDYVDIARPHVVSIV